MRKLMFILIFTSGFAQINWQIEIVDSGSSGPWHFELNSLALDTLNKPHIAYGDTSYYSRIFYASRIDSYWQKEEIESGLIYYGFSLIFDNNNIPHLSYYRKDDTVGKTYIAHAWCENTIWQIEVIDSIVGDFDEWINWVGYRKTSIDLDTSDLLGIAYLAWNIVDSLSYVKYAHYNGTNWDTTLVEYDSAYANTQTRPTDFSPSLEFNSTNVPYVAFQQMYQDNDTLKIAYYDDTLICWVVEPIMYTSTPWFSVSLKLNKSDYPRITHNVDGWLYFTWWDGVSWFTEGITATGWYRTKYHLELDSLENPHILYLPDPLVAHPCYCYKENNTWYLCGWVEPDTTTLTLGDISLSLDKNDQPHVAYQFDDGYIAGVKYARGTFIGIEEEESPHFRQELRICPNPSYGILSLDLPNDISDINLFDPAGRLIKKIAPVRKLKLDLLPGVYFLQIKTKNQTKTEKIVILN